MAYGVSRVRGGTSALTGFPPCRVAGASLARDTRRCYVDERSNRCSPCAGHVEPLVSKYRPRDRQ
eukprot:243390-Prymnesium_polylepis.1